MLNLPQIWDRLGSLQAGWNGYKAEPPSKLAIVRAKEFVEFLLSEDYPPIRVAPSAIGGIGITKKKNSIKVYVEFYNDGHIQVLFSDRISIPRSRAVEFSKRGFRRLLKEMKTYLEDSG